MYRLTLCISDYAAVGDEYKMFTVRANFSNNNIEELIAIIEALTVTADGPLTFEICKIEEAD